jgi:hypothetical protein
MHVAVDAEPERLRRQRLWSACRAVGGQAARRAVMRLRRGEPQLEIGYASARRIVDRCRLGMPDGGVIGLEHQILMDRAVRLALTPIPHHGGEECQVRGRERPSVQRQLLRRRKRIRVVRLDQLELRAGGDW